MVIGKQLSNKYYHSQYRFLKKLEVQKETIRFIPKQASYTRWSCDQLSEIIYYLHTTMENWPFYVSKDPLTARWLEYTQQNIPEVHAYGLYVVLLCHCYLVWVWKQIEATKIICAENNRPKDKRLSHVPNYLWWRSQSMVTFKF